MSKINRNYDLYVNLIMNLTLSLFVYCNFISFSVNAVNSDNQTETALDVNAHPKIILGGKLDLYQAVWKGKNC